MTERQFAMIAFLGCCCCLAVLPAMAADGDIYRCVVADFNAFSPTSSKDTAFEMLNRNKTFDVFELRNKFTVVSNSNSKAFTSDSTDYDTIGDDVLGARAIAKSSISIDTFILGRSGQEVDANRYEATITTQSSDYVNTWFLTCIGVKRS
ncbi:hypothetical protein [Mesorhizobium sp. M1E.F.Ca.ET.063.01.1.1]|uniref:hypothetical protein n=1 Tax=Mesorhizobium sp. M1E.F.Ca.ET.063.01.1.1 TaxID=2496750 RepID=UPI000FCB7D5B|nr:hypothetical protein [Mesorhizobium sp. M1E.F.Ca.ET.063.01.1.1]RUW85307.1 hypothetical protein EOA29_05425 [Mesorhizobium sp. M1E.F.Ca.ET.063.01.1.1]